VKILVAAAEFAGIVDKGGVAQYALGLVSELIRAGHEVRVAIPRYGFISAASGPPHSVNAKIECIGDDADFESVTSAGGIYHNPESFERWISFSRAAVDYACSWRPDVLHCQDAHACMIPVFIEQLRSEGNRVAASIGTVLTIHNLLEQGKGPYDLFAATLLPDRWYHRHFEFYGGTNCLKAGLMTADVVTTVSRTYAQEIRSSEDFGFGLSGVLNSLPKPVKGILNGIDELEWALDGLKYDGSDSISDLVTRKMNERKRLFPEWAWGGNEPLIAFKARWDRQKGIELMPEAISALIGKARIIFDTWPDPGSGGEYVSNEKTVTHAVSDKFIAVWRKLEALRAQHPLRLMLNAPGTTSPKASPALYAAADFFLMQSVYEPCGLAQMECQRYGCIPIVRRTGGLAETVSESGESPNGFVFDSFDKDDLVRAVNRAIETFHDKDAMARLMSNALRQKNGWNNRIQDYVEVYTDATNKALGSLGYPATKAAHG
jgi:starch synthase